MYTLTSSTVNSSTSDTACNMHVIYMYISLQSSEYTHLEFLKSHMSDILSLIAERGWQNHNCSVQWIQYNLYPQTRTHVGCI